ncbi:MAG TPA: DUF3040 domain-containing protein [Jatrophihabitantaceae bacterium]|jgi:hypothetical protein
MRLTREELLRLRDIERHLAAEEPGLDRVLRGRAQGRAILLWAKMLGLAWLPSMLIGDATGQVGFAIAGIVLLLVALLLAMIGLTQSPAR